jgi:hypothetical protein
MRPSPFRRTRRVVGALAALAASLLPAAARAQAPGALPPAVAPVADSAVPGSELTVYLVTMGPGDLVWEKFGHNAIRIVDRARGTDVSYNWGIFDFNAADFIPRFLKGSMRYWMAGYPSGPMIAAYAETDRPVWQQELALTPAQRARLRDLAETNALPENAYYTYDYFLDNCSTRVRDLLDTVLGGALQARFDTVATGTSYRFHTRRLTQGEPAIYTGMDLVLGQPGDRPISAWAEMFLPVRMREHLRALTVVGEDGVRRPLVAEETTLYEARRAPEPAAPRSYLFAYVAAGAAIGIVLVALAQRATRRGGAAAFATVGTLWALVVGLVGLIMTLTWAATDHEFMYRNENLLHFLPLALVLAVVLPRFARRRTGTLAPALATLVLLSSLAGLALQTLPGFFQTNGEAIALALPGHLGLAYGIWRLRALGTGTSAPLLAAMARRAAERPVRRSV